MDLKVKVLKTPISERYCKIGDEATLDINNKQIRCSGAWFPFDERWSVQPLSIEKNPIVTLPDEMINTNFEGIEEEHLPITIMPILTYNLKTALGEVIESESDNIRFLTQEQIDNFNSIGYRGTTTNGIKMSRVEYLNSLNPKQEQFSLYQTKFDNGDFREEFILTRVIIPQSK